MAGLASTLTSLLGNRKAVTAALKALNPGEPFATEAEDSRLRQVRGFGSNPGALDMYVYEPPSLSARPPLVVVLHGCGQSAAGYDRGAGWSDLADRHGFVLLFPQQTKINNAHRCFNWFQPGDTTRDSGEALSIRQMVEHAVAEHGVDRSRIHVTGLSAGGAMAGVMLATYPDVFAAGAVIAGLPYGAASNVQQALESMAQARPRSSVEWGNRVRTGSSHAGSWPRLSVWHGDADTVVKPGNATALIQQWTNLHGLSESPTARDAADGHPRAVWRNLAGEDVIESVTIGGMGHGTPLSVGTGDMQGGAAGAFMLDVGISSTHHIARFFGLTADRPAQAKAGTGVARRPASARVVQGNVDWTTPKAPPSGPAAMPDWANPDAVGANVSAVIAKALKSAGLAK